MRVLLVEDEQLMANTLRRGLRAEGFVVTVADNGEDGLWLATEGSYDVVVLDIMLPKLNGYKVLQAMREKLVWTPVLMLTAKDGEYDQTDAFDLGADDYLTKPFSFIVLVAHLRALARRAAPGRPMNLTAGDLTLDPARRVVQRANVEVTLTAREFDVLHYLIRNVGIVVSKSGILQNVWDAHYDRDDNIVEVYIGYLRRKIDTPFGVTSIRTIRGSGYRLDEVSLPQG